MNFLHKAIQQAKDTAAVKEAGALPDHNTLIDVMVENLTKPQKSRSHTQIHASDITKDDFCPREILLRDFFNTPRKDQFHGAALAATFDIGNVTADLVRQKWLGAHALGGWQCVICKTYRPLQKKPAKTDSGSCTHYWQYREIKVDSHAYGFSGSFDLIADLTGVKYSLCEIKIINPDDFEELVAPEAEHRLRTNLYLWLVEHGTPSYANQIDHQMGRVLYVARTFGKKSKGGKHKHNGKVLPWKEFEVYRNDADLKIVLDRAAQVKQGRALKLLPQRVCANSWCQQAKGCEMVSVCFDPKKHFSPLPTPTPSVT